MRWLLIFALSGCAFQGDYWQQEYAPWPMCKATVYVDFPFLCGDQRAMGCTYIDTVLGCAWSKITTGPGLDERERHEADHRAGKTHDGRWSNDGVTYEEIHPWWQR